MHICNIYGDQAIFLAPWVFGPVNAVINIKKPSIYQSTTWWIPAFRSLKRFSLLTDISCWYFFKVIQDFRAKYNLSQCYLLARVFSWPPLSSTTFLENLYFYFCEKSTKLSILSIRGGSRILWAGVIQLVSAMRNS